MVRKEEKILNICMDIMECDITQDKKTTELVFLRAIFYKVCKELYPTASFSKIGSLVKKDHSTVIYGIKLFDNEVRFKEGYRQIYKDCKEKCRNALVREDSKIDKKEELILDLMAENEGLKTENIRLKRKLKRIGEFVMD